MYTKEFKAEAVALAEKREKSVIQVARDLGISDTVLHRLMQVSREAKGDGVQPFPGHGRPRDEELARLRKENKTLRTTNEILKKAGELQFESSSHRENPRDGVPVHTAELGPVGRQGDDRTFEGEQQRLLLMGQVRGIGEAERG